MEIIFIIIGALIALLNVCLIIGDIVYLLVNDDNDLAPIQHWNERFGTIERIVKATNLNNFAAYTFYILVPFFYWNVLILYIFNWCQRPSAAEIEAKLRRKEERKARHRGK